MFLPSTPARHTYFYTCNFYSNHSNLIALTRKCEFFVPLDFVRFSLLNKFHFAYSFYLTLSHIFRWYWMVWFRSVTLIQIVLSIKCMYMEVSHLSMSLLWLQCKWNEMATPTNIQKKTEVWLLCITSLTKISKMRKGRTDIRCEWTSQEGEGRAKKYE